MGAAVGSIWPFGGFRNSKWIRAEQEAKKNRPDGKATFVGAETAQAKCAAQPGLPNPSDVSDPVNDSPIPPGAIAVAFTADVGSGDPPIGTAGSHETLGERDTADGKNYSGGP